MTQDIKSIYREFIEQAWNKGDSKIIDRLVAPSYVVRTPSIGIVRELRGPKGFKEFLDSIKTAVPDGKVTIDTLIAEDDRVFASWTARGHNTGSMFRLPPSGKEITIRGMGVTTIRDGKIVESSDTWDMLELLMQFGLRPKMDKRKAVSRRLIEEAWNDGNLGVIEELLLDPEDRRIQLEMAKAFREGFKPLHVRVVDQVAEGDTVATTWVADGTHHATVLNIPPTGRQVSIRGMNVDVVVDGKMKSCRTSVDNWELLQQLGVHVG